MIDNLTDGQVARIFRLCDEIAAVKKELPAPPPGFDVSIEIARNLRVSLAQHTTTLKELMQILQASETGELGPVSPANPSYSPES